MTPHGVAPRAWLLWRWGATGSRYYGVIDQGLIRSIWVALCPGG